MSGLRVNTACPTCRDLWFTEVDDDFARNTLVLRMSHRGAAVERHVSREILALAVPGARPFETTVASATEALARHTLCLEFKPVEEPLWKRANGMGFGPIFADPAIAWRGAGPAPAWASPA